MRVALITLGAAAAFVVSLTSQIPAGQEAVGLKKEKAAAAAAEIIEMRSALAKEFVKPGVEVTEQTFEKVCGAVARRAKEIAERDRLSVRNAAVKYRNPKNAATPEETFIIAKFEEKPDLRELWDNVGKDGKNYVRIIKPVYVEQACLACHGPADKRPAFIVEKYPDDKAYGFRTGALRSILTVMAPRD